MINQPAENEPLSRHPMQCAASVMVKANKWLPAFCCSGQSITGNYKQLILHGFIHRVPQQLMEELLCGIHKKPQELEYQVCRLLRPIHTLALLVFLRFFFFFSCIKSETNYIPLLMMH